VTFQDLALISAAALLGPLLATPGRLRVPLLIGELAAGIALGNTGLRELHPQEETFAFLADIGFALVMFVAGTHVPVRDSRLWDSMRRGAARAVAVGIMGVLLGWAVATAFGTDHAAIYAVVIASSSAALILPMTASLRSSDPGMLDLLAQVAVADTACIVALPILVEPDRALGAAGGAAVVILAAAAIGVCLTAAERSGLRKKVQRFSERRKYALGLRLSLLSLFALAALARQTHVSVMLAGFSLGVATAAAGEPRRLAHQLFALTEGFFGPLFFVWIGSTLDLRAFAEQPNYLLLGCALGVSALIAHGVMRLANQEAGYATIAAAQLGVPIAAVTLGVQGHLLRPGEPAAILLGALITIAAAAVATASTARKETHQARRRAGVPKAGEERRTEPHPSRVM
jgi:Kef-type K+ transport system membrane component KefB